PRFLAGSGRGAFIATRSIACSPRPARCASYAMMRGADHQHSGVSTSSCWVSEIKASLSSRRASTTAGRTSASMRRRSSACQASSTITTGQIAGSYRGIPRWQEKPSHTSGREHCALSTVTRIPGAQSPRVSIIIPASSTQAMLLGCLQSIARYSPVNIAYEVIVVLNEADENTAARLCEIVAGAHIVASPVNLGLAGSGNRGRHLARGELLVLLHDDAEIEPGWLEALVDTADAHPEAGAIGGKVLFPDGRLQNAGMILWSDAYT